jgi:hypothetical protein
MRHFHKDSQTRLIRVQREATQKRYAAPQRRILRSCIWLAPNVGFGSIASPWPSVDRSRSTSINGHFQSRSHVTKVAKASARAIRPTCASRRDGTHNPCLASGMPPPRRPCCARALTCPTGNSRIRAMCKLPVVPICRRSRRLRRRANHNDALAHPASMKRDVSADRHDTWGGDAVDADGTSDERGGRGR